MYRPLLPVLLAVSCAPTADGVHYLYGGGEGLVVTFLAADDGPAAEGAVAFAGAPRDHLHVGCLPGEARFLTSDERLDGGVPQACMDAASGFPEVGFGALAGPVPLREAAVVVADGAFSGAVLRFDETDDARVSAELDAATARVDLGVDALEGTVEVDAAFDHVGPHPDRLRTEWVQTVRFSWSFDRSVREVVRFENEDVVLHEAAAAE
ncbi:MAG: hypothetical protein ACK4YP_01645 [Myxococcota bacterium]